MAKYQDSGKAYHVKKKQRKKKKLKSEIRKSQLDPLSKAIYSIYADLD